MSLEELQERFKDLQEATTQVRDLISRIADLEFPPGSPPLRADEDDSVLAELGSEVIQALREGEDELEALTEEVDDLFGNPEGWSEDQTRRFKDDISRFHKELSGYRVSFRQAQLSARKRLAEAQRSERSVVVQSCSPPSPTAEPSTDGPTSPHPHSLPQAPHRRTQASALSEEDQQVVAASAEATRGLHRLRDNIEKALLLSNATHETLNESSAALAGLGESYTSLETMLSSSKQLVATLVRSRKSDTWYLQTSLYMLFVTLAWLVFRRWLYGPVWWIVWLPLRLVFRTSVGVGNVMRPGEKAVEERTGQEQGGPVEGLPDESLPTAKVGHEARDSGDVDSDSMVEKVGKIIDEGEAQAGSDPAADKGERAVNEADNPPSPEEDGSEAVNDKPRNEGAPVKDEL